MINVQNNGSKNVPDIATEGESSVQTVPRVETPKMYKVILLNDDYTPMDFVVLILRRFFAKSEDEATKVMLDVHKKGAGVAGVFTLEVAEMKVMQVNQFSQMNEHPLKSTLEEE
jgi:ATP-dependent Clp protease adaptor protein ClpS